MKTPRYANDIPRRDSAIRTISLKLPEELLEASGHCACALRMSRASYLHTAIARMNRDIERRLRARQLAAVSRRVREESMRVNGEFSAIEQAPLA